MKKIKKIKAFTISEMVVVIILSSIVVGLAFTVLSLVQKHISSIQDNFSRRIELNKLEQSLWIDFNNHSKITYDIFKNNIVLTNEMDSIYYLFSDHYIVKERDTFHIRIQNKTVFFNGNQVNSGSIDALKLELSDKGQGLSLFVFKENDATSFIN